MTTLKQQLRAIPLILIVLTLSCSLSSGNQHLPSQSEWSIVDTAAASQWDHGYPVGNGRLGMLSLGQVENETIYLNENSIWAGQTHTELPDNADEVIREIRDLCRERKYSEADKLFKEKMLTGFHASTYEHAGELRIEHHNLNQPTITRELNLYTGVSSAVASDQEATITQTIIALPDPDLIAVRLHTTAPPRVLTAPSA